MENRYMYKLYRWAHGEVVDSFLGTEEECKEYAEKWKGYCIEWVKL